MENVMAALMQVLRIHDLSLIEQGNNIIIHRNPRVNGISQVQAEGIEPQKMPKDAEIVTRVFRLNTLDTEKAAKLVKPLLSEVSIVEGIPETSTIVVTDIAVNVQKTGQLLKGLDSPASGLVIGQYQVTSAILDSLIPLAQQIMGPIAEGKPLVFTPHVTSNSIFIVSTPFLVERSIAVLRNLDVNNGSTRIFTNDALRFESQSAQGIGQGGPGGVFAPPGQIPLGQPIGPGGLGTAGGPGGPAGVGGPGGFGTGSLTEQQLLDLQRGGLTPGSIGQNAAWTNQLPVGHIQRTQFYIQKLRYRKGEQIVLALGRIAESLGRTGTSNADIVAAISSLQWIESSNSLVYTGTSEALLKVKELVDEIDTPLRQVFLEMLIMEMTLADSLTYGVNWGTRFFNGYTSGSQNFISNSNPLAGAMDTADNISGVINQGGQTVLNGITPFPNSSLLTKSFQDGYSLGIIGRTLTHNGIEFASLSALVKALHRKEKEDIVMNPKILTEDNSPATLFVGVNTRFQTQSISNDQGTIVTNNFEFRDVGTTLSITPLISSNDIITLDIKQEVSRVLPTTNTGGGGLANLPAGPSTSKNTTTTRVHVPNKFFIIISGMMHDDNTRVRSQVPCLGGAPGIGAFFSEKIDTFNKNNLIIFIRPEIIDTEEEIQHLTRHNQNIWNQKRKTTKMWQLETDEALDWMNIKSPDNFFQDREQYNP
jgi:type III secretion protein C